MQPCPLPPLFEIPLCQLGSRHPMIQLHKEGQLKHLATAWSILCMPGYSQFSGLPGHLTLVSGVILLMDVLCTTFYLLVVRRLLTEIILVCFVAC